MRTLLLTIGNEITSGYTLNGNAAWIARALEAVGLTPERVVTIRDETGAMRREIRAALKKYQVVIITGGLGPTHDDITKPALAAVFKVGYYRDKNRLRDVRRFFTALNKPIPEVNYGQADVPDGFVAIPNRWGTAPGLYIHHEGCHLFALPGVPQEMRGLMRSGVIPILKKASSCGLARKVYHTVGVGESSLAPLIEATGVPDEIEVAFLPQMGRCDLRLTVADVSQRAANKKLRAAAAKVSKVVADFCYGTDDDTLESVIGDLLRQGGRTLAAAESCTGGLFAAAITSVPGASDYFLEAAVTYSNDSKHKRLRVKEKTLDIYGAVSAEVAAEMANGICATAGASVGISATGVAGPGGGSAEKPVGTIWLGLCIDGTVQTKLLRLGFDRKSNQVRTANDMLVWLWHELNRRNAQRK